MCEITKIKTSSSAIVIRKFNLGACKRPCTNWARRIPEGQTFRLCHTHDGTDGAATGTRIDLGPTHGLYASVQHKGSKRVLYVSCLPG